MNRLITFCLLFWMLPVADAQVVVPCSVPFNEPIIPKHEVRAVWLTTLNGLDWPHTLSTGTVQSIAAQQSELVSLLDKLQQAGINTVLFQTRIRGTSLYPSSEPWDKCLTGTFAQSPGYDPLAFAINECHKRGMEIHAWIVTLPLGKWSDKGCAAFRRRYSSLAKRVGDEGYMNPEKPQTATLLAALCADLASRYDLDGIHLDYIRYPEKWKVTVSAAQARQNITHIVQEIHDRVKAVKPWVKLSCSPIGKYSDLPRQSSMGWNAYSRVYQEAQSWLQKGLMDMLFPMMYAEGNQFYPFAADWIEHAYGRVVAPGLGIYFLSPHEKDWSLPTIAQEMSVLRMYGMGHAFFRSQFLTDNVKGIYTFVADDFDRYLALVPAMSWANKEVPTAPESVVLDNDTHTLSWSAAVDRSGGDYLTYNIYSSRAYPVDVSQACNLVLMRQMSNALQVQEGRYYAVTAMDRFGNESEATQQKLGWGSVLLYNKSTPTLIFESPKIDITAFGLNRSDLLQIETLQGRVVKAMFQAKEVDVSDLPPGWYVLRSIGKKNISHRLCLFRVKME